MDWFKEKTVENHGSYTNHYSKWTSWNVFKWFFPPARWSLDFTIVTSSFHPSSPSFLPTGNSKSQCAAEPQLRAPDLGEDCRTAKMLAISCKLQITVGTAGPQPRAFNRELLPDLNREFQTSVSTAEPELRSPDHTAGFRSRALPGTTSSRSQWALLDLKHCPLRSRE